MNRTKIEWTQFTWNYMVGCTGEGCAVKDVCYARAQAKRQKHRCILCYNFTPHIHPDRVMQPLHRKTPSLIFAVSMGDIMGGNLRMTKVGLDIMEKAHWHTFQILTKQAQRLQWHSPYPRNVWVGVTVNQQHDVWRLDRLKEVKAKIKFVSFEPLYGPIDYDLHWLNWIIIGAQTRPEKQPEPEWIRGILHQAWKKLYEEPVEKIFETPHPAIFVKDNVKRPPVRLHEFPVGSGWVWTSKGPQREADL